MLARMIQGMFPALAPTGTSSLSSSSCPLLSSKLLDDDDDDDSFLLSIFFLTLLLMFLAILLMFLLAILYLMMNVLIYFLVLIQCSYLLSLFQVPPAAEKMEVLQSHLEDLFPPVKDEDAQDDDEDSK